MNSRGWEAIAYMVTFSLAIIGVVIVLSLAVLASGIPNHTAVACIEAGMELIDGNCLTP